MAKLSLVFCYFIVLVLFFTNKKCQATESCEAVGVYKLKRGDLSLKFTNYGATMLSAVIPDKNGQFLYPPSFQFVQFILLYNDKSPMEG